MTDSALISLMQEHGVRLTANRLLIARALESAGRPLSMTELEDLLETIDKSGVFRTLQLFREAGLVHVLEDSGDGVRYELCHSHCHDAGSHDDLHVHFYCERCHRTFCLDESPVPEVAVPAGYTPLTRSFLVRGLCPSCSPGSKTATK